MNPCYLARLSRFGPILNREVFRGGDNRTRAPRTKSSELLDERGLSGERERRSDLTFARVCPTPAGIHRQILFGGLRIGLYDPVKKFYCGPDHVVRSRAQATPTTQWNERPSPN